MILIKNIEKADTRNKIINLEKRVEKLSDFIIDEGLAEKFNKYPLAELIH